ncbi:hypothetical protein BJV77DRAFT_960898 [Russula vinacea]|nr:hypothetical protein BJV77DRAFT_960898 [Russula vinacea]
MMDNTDHEIRVSTDGDGEHRRTKVDDRDRRVWIDNKKKVQLLGFAWLRWSTGSVDLAATRTRGNGTYSKGLGGSACAVLCLLPPRIRDALVPETRTATPEAPIRIPFQFRRLQGLRQVSTAAARIFGGVPAGAAGSLAAEMMTPEFPGQQQRRLFRRPSHGAIFSSSGRSDFPETGSARDPDDPTWGEGEKTSRWRRRRLRTTVEQAALRVVAFCAEDAELGGKGAAWTWTVCGDKQREVGHFGSPGRGYLKGLAVGSAESREDKGNRSALAGSVTLDERQTACFSDAIAGR